MSTIYERSSIARAECIKKHGYKCAVCGITMEEKYGAVGKEFIHVHHKNFISNYKAEHKIDAVNDLITVCPNCHSMLHRKNNGNYFSVEELKDIIEKGNASVAGGNAER